MNPKNIKILAIIFFTLFLVVAFPWVKENFTKEKKDKKFENISVNFSNFTEGNVEKISIKKGDEEIILAPQNGTWKLEDKEVSPEKISELFQNLDEAKIQKQSSKNKENHAKFEVTPEKAHVLTITSGETDSVFFIGKNGPSFDSFYARKKGVANVYLVKGNLKSFLFTTSIDDWGEKDETQSDESKEPEIQMP